MLRINLSKYHIYILTVNVNCAKMVLDEMKLAILSRPTEADPPETVMFGWEIPSADGWWRH